MDKKRKQQFAMIEKAGSAVKQWASGQSILLDNIAVVVPFVEGEFDLHVVIFFQKNSDLECYGGDGTTDKLEEKYRASLKELGYPDDWFEQVTFEFDSKENVDANFDGSYFYRMR